MNGLKTGYTTLRIFQAATLNYPGIQLLDFIYKNIHWRQNENKKNTPGTMWVTKPWCNLERIKYCPSLQKFHRFLPAKYLADIFHHVVMHPNLLLHRQH